MKINRTISSALRRRAFTLLELLVVMGLLILLAVLTGIGVNRLSGQAKLSSGVNTVLAALGNARAYAIQNNVTTMATFRVKVNTARLSEPEVVEVVFAKATGVLTPWLPTARAFHERYVPVAGMPAMQLPRGIKVAGPLSADWDNPNQDDVWVTQPGGKWRLYNDPARGIVFCNRCCTEREPNKHGARGYVCGVCMSKDVRIVEEPTGRWAI